jgi:GTPase SAR1 family protein
MTTPISFKFVFIGSSGVGKTAILKHPIEDILSSDSQSTISVVFDPTTVEIDGQTGKLQI